MTPAIPLLALSCAWAHADVVRVMPSKAIEFAAFDAYKKVLCRQDPETGVYIQGSASSALAGGAAGASQPAWPAWLPG